MRSRAQGVLAFATILATCTAGILHLAWWAAVAGACLLALISIYNHPVALRASGGATTPGVLLLSSALNATLATEVNGLGWMVGPYATLRLTDNLLFWQARTAWGRSSNEVSPFLTYTDKFETDGWLVSSTLTGRWGIGPWVLRPSASVAYICVQELHRHLRRRDPRGEIAARASQGGTGDRLSLPTRPRRRVRTARRAAGDLELRWRHRG